MYVRIFQKFSYRNAIKISGNKPNRMNDLFTINWLDQVYGVSNNHFPHQPEPFSSRDAKQSRKNAHDDRAWQVSSAFESAATDRALILIWPKRGSSGK